MLEHISELSNENPFIEPPETRSKDLRVFRLDGSRNSYRDDDEKKHTNELWDSANAVKINGGFETIYDHLISQINTLPVSKETAAIMYYLTYTLDSNGFLYDDPNILAKSKQLSPEKIKNILNTLKELEPPGVFASSLKECLLLQIKRLGGDDICEKIIENHLEDLWKRHYNAISKALCIGDDKVRLACAEIVKLNPRPAVGFSGKEMPVFVVPDLELIVEGENWEVLPIAQNRLSVSLNTYYVELTETNDDPKLKTYLKTHLENANKVIACLEQRHSTVLNVAKLISEESTGKPLSDQKIADILASDGMKIARRTVAKYRDNLGIAPATARK